VGRRVYTNTRGHWGSITLTGGMRLPGVTAAPAFPGATNTDMFETHAEGMLVPELKPGDLVIRDDLKPYQSEEAVEAAGQPAQASYPDMRAVIVGIIVAGRGARFSTLED